jgi:hypothetical protein
VSNEAFGPQYSHLLLRFGLRNYFKLLNLKSGLEFSFLYKFRKSFVFFAQKYRSTGSTSDHLSEMSFMSLESV